jgi:hypothetical protein
MVQSSDAESSDDDHLETYTECTPIARVAMHVLKHLMSDIQVHPMEYALARCVYDHIGLTGLSYLDPQSSTCRIIRRGLQVTDPVFDDCEMHDALETLKNITCPDTILN